MKKFKPYLFLTKNEDNYELNFIVSCKSDQTIESIIQQEVEVEGKKYWGVIITLSDQTQLVNCPENPIFSSIVQISTENSVDYSTIKCIVMERSISSELQPTQTQSTDIDFVDA